MTRPAEAQSRRQVVPLGRVALVWALICVLVTTLNLGNIITRRFPDPDDILRLIQVRDLLAGQAWFDLHQYRLNPPAGTLMHWSRLVDLPLAAMIGLLSPLVGQGVAEQVTLIAAPLLTLAVLVWVVARIAIRFFDKEAMTFACLALGMVPLLVAQVQPLRIDHHAWQIVCAMGALLGLLPGKSYRGAMIAGGALALGLSISLEMLPVAAAFGAVFALRWLADRDRKPDLPVFLAALAAGLAALFLATRGLADLAMHCDVVTPAYLALFAIVAAGASALAAGRVRSPIAVLAGLGACGAVGAAIYLWLSPQCLSGPFGNLDPLVREYWYENVQEGRPAWRAPWLLAVPAVAQGLGGLAVVFHLWRKGTGAERQWWLEYLIVATVAFVTGVLVWRAMALVGALSAIPLGWLATRLLKRMHDSARPRAKMAAAVAMVLVLVPSFPGAVGKAFAPPAAAGEIAADETHTASSACGLPASAELLDALAPATLFAPLDIGPGLLLMTRHAVVASSHHRAQAAMRDVIVAFTGPSAAARPIVSRHHAQFVILCPELVETRLYAERAPHGFAADLLEGRAPAWLEPVALKNASGLKLWRVRT